MLSNSNKTLTVPVASITGTHVIFNTAGGGDTLTMDLSGGTFTKSLTFNGQMQTMGDGLIVKGSGTQTATYTPNAATPGNGVVVTSAGTITFTGLEPVDITGMATATLNLPGAADVLTLVNGFDFLSGGTNQAIRVSGSSGGTSIEAAAFWNNTTLVIDTVTGGSDGNDAITVNSASVGGNTNLTINTGVGTDTVNIKGAVSFAGAVSITTVDVNLIAAGTMSTGTGLTVTNTGFASNLIGVISGVGLTKSGAGILTLSGTNDYTGTTDVQAGTLLIYDASALGVISDGTTVEAGATLYVIGNLTIAEPLTLSGELGVGGFPASVIDWSGTILLSGANTTFEPASVGDQLTVSGVISDGGLGFTKSGDGTLILSNTNTFTGATKISDGTLQVSGGDAIPDGGAVVIDDADNTSPFATLDLLSSETIGDLSSNGDTNVVAHIGSGRTLTVNQTSNTTFAGAITNTDVMAIGGSLVKEGNGTLTLSGANTYTRATTISGGTLALSGAFTNNIPNSPTIDVQSGSYLDVTGLTSGTLVLANGQTLEGQGTVTGKTTADTGSHVSPGESPGILHTGDVTFNSGSNFDVEINGPTVGTDYDQLNVTGLVTLTDATLNLSGSYVPLTGETFTIIDNDDSVDAVIGTFAGLAEGAGIASFLGSSLNAQISYQGGDGNDVILTVPEVTVSASPSSVAENSGTGLVYTFTRSGSTAAALTVNFDVGGTAMFNATPSLSDYTESGAASFSATSGTVTFASGSSTATVTLTPVDDSVVEADETAILTIATGTNYNVGTTSNATTTITDNDSATVSLAGTTHGAEAGPVNATFTVTQTAASSTDTVISYSVGGSATSGLDFSALSGTVTILAGDTTATITVPVLDDALVEATETVILTLTMITAGDTDITLDGTAANLTATRNITDNDTATYMINDVTVNEAAGTLDFTVSVSNPVDIAVDIDVTYADVSTGAGDFTHTAGVAHFAAGNTTSQTVSVPITNDNIVEATETFTASLSTSTALGGRSVVTSDTGTGTITDDDSATLTLSSVSATNLEGNIGTTAFTFQVVLSNDVQGGLTLAYTTDDGTATVADNDYVDNDGSLNFAGTAGEMKTITVLVNGDLNPEFDETFTVVLGAISNTTAMQAAAITTLGSPQTGTILNDDMLDYGDAPTKDQSGVAASYPTTRADNGARHFGTGPRLGPNIDYEVNGQPSAGANADDLNQTGIPVAGNDEDGITFSTTLLISASGSTTASIQVDLQNADPTANYLDAWIDLNHDGVWSAGEEVVADVNLGTTSGMKTVSFTLPQDSNAAMDSVATFARFRLSSTGGLAPTGLANDGEVEDYQVTLVQSNTSNTAVVNLPPTGGDFFAFVSGGQYVVTDGIGNVLLSYPLADANAIIINGNDGLNETLTVNFVGGNAIPAGGLTFNGGTGDVDQLNLINGTFDTETFDFFNEHDGRVSLSANGGVVNYTGLDPISSTINVTNVILNYSNAAETITVTQNGAQTQVDSNVGGEVVSFNNPTATLKINTGDVGNNVVNVFGFGNNNLLAALLTINGGDAQDTFNVNTGDTFTGAIINGFGGNDSFTVDSDLNATFLHLNGGTKDDTFTINTTLNGQLDGQSNTAAGDTLQGTVINDVVLTGSDADGFNGTEADIPGNFDGIDAFIGNGPFSGLQGRNTANTWVVNGTATYNDGSQSATISGFGFLVGGSSTDQFTVSGPSAFNLVGGSFVGSSGNDTFTIDATLTGEVIGFDGNDLLQGTQISDVALLGINFFGGSDTGFFGTEADISGGFIVGGIAGIETIIGNGTAILRGIVGDQATWNVGGSETYVDNTVGATLNFSGFTTLDAGNQGDTFDVSGNGNPTVTLNGGTGSDTLQGSQIDNVVLLSSNGLGYSGTEDSIGSFTGINRIHGSNQPGASLQGRDFGSTWTLNGAASTYNDGLVVLPFDGFRVLQGGNSGDTFNLTGASSFDSVLGGAGGDNFNFNGGFTLTAAIDGQGGADVLQGLDINNVVLTGAAANGEFNGTENNIIGSFAGIGSIVGNGSGTLTGDDNVSTWTLNGVSPTYTDTTVPASMTFSGFTTLQAGSGVNTFNVSAPTVENLAGGASGTSST